MGCLFRARRDAVCEGGADSSRVSSVFDGLAPQYDDMWTRSAVGRLQREAVWRRLDELFRPGDRLIDLGCGTGEDALHFASLGIAVRAIDTSPGMVRIARARGVDASVLPIEELQSVSGTFDGAISNFGALNCVADLRAVSSALAGLIRPGGRLAICVMGRFCLWETLWYLLRCDLRRAFQRLRPVTTDTPQHVRVHHFSIRRLGRAFDPEFTLVEWRGIGLAVPPSYVPALPRLVYRWFGAIDRRAAHWPVLRALGDHRLAVFIRNPVPRSA